jgi:hypothetical protein
MTLRQRRPKKGDDRVAATNGEANRRRSSARRIAPIASEPQPVK